MEFSLPEDVTAYYNITYYANSSKGGALINATAPVQNGHYSLKGVTRLPTLLYITTGANTTPTVAYAERGNKITITGEGADPATWEIGGNKINVRLSEWRREYADTLTKGSRADINAAVSKYVMANPSDPVSTIILLTYFSRIDDQEGYLRLWKSLKGEARDDKWIFLVGRSDQPSYQYSQPAILRSVIFRSADNGIDTIIPSRGRATMLFFWANSIKERNSYIDSLKVLSEEFPDSSSRIIADVSLEIDSISWRTSMKKDSLHNVARLWAPHGLSDRWLMKLSVPDYPYFIVYDPEGLPVFRGSDTGDALKAFRNLMDTVAPKN